MNIQVPNFDRTVRDLIVGTKDDEVTVELDIQHNNTVRLGDQFAVDWDDGSTSVLRVVGFRSAESYTPVIARATDAQREGVMGVPTSTMARKAYQTKLAIMRIEGELLSNGGRRVGASRVPDVMLPVKPLGDDAVERFSTDQNGNMLLGRLRSGNRTLTRDARLQHNYAGDRMIIVGMPGKGKTQLVRALLSQAMAFSSDQDDVVENDVDLYHDNEEELQ